MSPFIIALIGLATVILCIVVLRLHAFLSLLFAALVTGLLTSETQLFEFAIFSGMSESAAVDISVQSIGARIGNAFGSILGRIGILIALASVIGMAMMRSGAAERIVRGLLKVVGRKNTDLAFLSSSFTLAIPVFFDTVFYLLIPIVKSASIRNPARYSLYLMCAIAGGVMGHSLIPPTPGPLYVAKELNIDLGTMIIAGFVVGGFTVICGYFYARWANQKWPLEMRDTADISMEELKATSDIATANLPGIGLSLLPIVLPVVLITGTTVLNSITGTNTTGFSKSLMEFFRIFGNSSIALLIGAICAMLLLWYREKNISSFEKHMTEALMSAGMIILITGAGGAFGQMLRQTNIGYELGQMAQGAEIAILPLAFIITMAVRTAQGSATVAMVTTIGVMSGIAGAGNLGFHPVYLAMVVGCGSKIFPWMNDSAFWIITKMSGMETKESIRFFSYLLTVMGISGLFIVMILAYFFPLVQ